jgi:hypothetical protein
MNQPVVDQPIDRQDVRVADQAIDRAVCRAAGCDRPVAYLGAGVCQAHYFRLRRTGTLGLEPIRPRRTGCEIPGCGRRHDARGLCATHYSRWQRYGSTELPARPPPSRGPDNASWRGDQVSYSGAHRRVRTILGPAAAHPCARCGTVPAAQWALIHGSPRQRTDPDDTGLPYSPDSQDYQPLCVSCHKRYDLAELAHRTTEWLW